MRTGLAILAFLVMATVASADQHFEIRGKFVQTEADKSESVITIPPIVVLEEKLAKYRTGGTVTTSSNPLGGGLSASGGLSVEMKITPVWKETLMVNLAVEYADPAVTNQSATTRSVSLSTVRNMTLGKTTKLVLQADAKGTPTWWLELKVAPAETETEK